MHPFTRSRCDCGDGSGCRDLNPGPQRPERCALTKLRYIPWGGASLALYGFPAFGRCGCRRHEAVDGPAQCGRIDGFHEFGVRVGALREEAIRLPVEE